jgi:hypothetical protein
MSEMKFEAQMELIPEAKRRGAIPLSEGNATQLAMKYSLNYRLKYCIFVEFSHLFLLGKKKHNSDF